jgi:putative methionine-R-sulfoxide reductase with GAF domain
VSTANDTTRRVQRYLSAADLDDLLPYAPRILQAIQNLMSALGGSAPEISLDTLYAYPVPLLSEDGSCSLIEELAPAPYDLRDILGAPSEAVTRKLILLNQLAEHATQLTGADWLGVYQARNNARQDRVLVKLAYRGRPSRAEFPLNEVFAKGSTNGAVGLSGRARVIDDVAAFTAAGGGFYVCDEAVQSEACLPLFDEAGAIIGIIDAEAAPKDFFNEDRLTNVIAAALIAPALLP